MELCVRCREFFFLFSLNRGSPTVIVQIQVWFKLIFDCLLRRVYISHFLQVADVRTFKTLVLLNVRCNNAFGGDWYRHEHGSMLYFMKRASIKQNLSFALKPFI